MKVIVENYYTKDYPSFSDPNDCPICHEKINPFRVAWVSEGFLNSKIEIVFLCNNKRCNHFFIAYYNKDKRNYFVLNKSEPCIYEEIKFYDEINSISPKFTEIYNQAMQAKFLGLNEIAGIGLRKSLEFLVKDYIIEFLKKDKNIIKKIQLGTAIEQNIDDMDIKETAKRATWIGNDETHYDRIWVNKDVEDLIFLIETCVSSMGKSIKTKKHFDDMNPIKKAS